MQLKDVCAVTPNIDLELALALGVNVMLAGGTADTSELLESIEARLRQPVVIVTCDRLTWLPDPVRTGTTGTIVLRDLSALSAAEQERLFDWLTEAARRVQVVSTTSLDIVPLIQAGMFLAPLYYRLNVLYVSTSRNPAISSQRPRPALRRASLSRP